MPRETRLTIKPHPRATFGGFHSPSERGGISFCFWKSHSL